MEINIVKFKDKKFGIRRVQDDYKDFAVVVDGVIEGWVSRPNRATRFENIRQARRIKKQTEDQTDEGEVVVE